MRPSTTACEPVQGAAVLSLLSDETQAPPKLADVRSTTATGKRNSAEDTSRVRVLEQRASASRARDAAASPSSTSREESEEHRAVRSVYCEPDVEPHGSSKDNEDRSLAGRRLEQTRLPQDIPNLPAPVALNSAPAASSKTTLRTERNGPGSSPPPSKDHHAETHISSCQRCRQIADNQRKLSQRREYILTKRAQVEDERTHLPHVRDRAVSAQREFLNALSSSQQASSPPERYTRRLEELHEQVHQAHNELQSQEFIVQGLENELSDLEYRHGKKEKEFYAGLRFPVSSASSYVDDGVASIEQEESIVPSEEDDEDVASIVNDYYDKAGDITIERERLEEFEGDHRRAITIRANMVANGQEVFPLEKDFLHDYFHGRRKLIQSYLKVKAEAQKLHEQCVTRGYSVSQFAGADYLHRPLDQAGRFRVNSHNEKVVNTTAQLGVKPLDLEEVEFENPQDRITQWVSQTFRAMASSTSSQPLDCNDEEPHATRSDAHAEPKPFSISESIVRLDPPPSNGFSPSTVSFDQLAANWPAETLEKRYSNPDLLATIVEHKDTDSQSVH
jgi:hypothetical protein